MTCTETNRNIQWERLPTHHLVTDIFFFFLIYSWIYQKDLENLLFCSTTSTSWPQTDPK